MSLFLAIEVHRGTNIHDSKKEKRGKKEAKRGKKEAKKKILMANTNP